MQHLPDTRTTTPWRRTVSVLVAGSIALASTPASAEDGACPEFTSGALAGTVAHSALTELSGLVASRQYPGVFWAHNDSGHAPTLFALTGQGVDLGEYALAATTMTDWEDIALGPGADGGPDILYVGDIGDNNANRSTIVVHRVPEPFADPGQAPVMETVPGVERLPMVYPGGAAYDAEVLMLDARTGDLYVITKHSSGLSLVFRNAAPHIADEVRTLEQVGSLQFGTPEVPSVDRLATAGDMAATGSEILVRTYSSAVLWLRPPDETVAQALTRPPCVVPFTADFLWPQGEAIAFTASADAYLTVSEGVNPPLRRYDRVPAPRLPEIVAILLLAEDNVRLTFEDPESGASSYEVERAFDLMEPDPWEVLEDAVILPLGGGVFQTDVPQGVSTSVFFRIGTLP